MGSEGPGRHRERTRRYDPRRGRAVRGSTRTAIAALLAAAGVAAALVLYLRQPSPPQARSSPSSAPVTRTESTGFGKARFGMTLEEVGALYPDIAELTKGLGAAVIEGPFVARRVLWKQKLLGLAEPVDVELRFWKNQLWVVIVYFGANDAGSVVKALTERHGPPRGGEATAAWPGAKSTIIMAGKAGWYSMHDNAISKDAQAVFIEDLKRSAERRRATRQRTTAEPGHGFTASTAAATPPVRATSEDER